MIAVNQISIDNGIIDFTPIESIAKGDYILLYAGEGILELESPSDASLDTWVAWVVNSYNMLPNTTATATLDGNKMVLTANDDNDLEIYLDLGSL